MVTYIFTYTFILTENWARSTIEFDAADLPTLYYQIQDRRYWIQNLKKKIEKFPKRNKKKLKNENFLDSREKIAFLENVRLVEKSAWWR